MRIVLLCLLFTSCAHNSRIIKSERHDTYLVGLKCPDGYYLRVSDLMCHVDERNLVKPTNSVKIVKRARKAAIKRIAVPIAPISEKPVRMTDRPLKIDCTRVMNQCFKGDL